MGKISESTSFKISDFIFRFRESSQRFVVEILTQNFAFNLSGTLFFIGLGCSLKWWYKDQLVITLLKQNLPAFSQPQQKISWETGEYFLGEQTHQFLRKKPNRSEGTAPYTCGAWGASLKKDLNSNSSCIFPSTSASHPLRFAISSMQCTPTLRYIGDVSRAKNSELTAILESISSTREADNAPAVQRSKEAAHHELELNPNPKVQRIRADDISDLINLGSPLGGLKTKLSSDQVSTVPLKRGNQNANKIQEKVAVRGWECISSALQRSPSKMESEDACEAGWIELKSPIMGVHPRPLHAPESVPLCSPPVHVQGGNNEIDIYTGAKQKSTFKNSEMSGLFTPQVRNLSPCSINDLIDRLDAYYNSLVINFKSPWQKHAYHRFTGIFPEFICADTPHVNAHVDALAPSVHVQSQLQVTTDGCIKDEDAYLLHGVRGLPSNSQEEIAKRRGTEKK